MNTAHVQYFAKGASCFPAGTLVGTPDGYQPIELLKAGSTITSFNETTKLTEESKVGKVDVKEDTVFYEINGLVKATGEHPFYTLEGIVKAKDLKVGMSLVGRYNEDVPVRKVEKIEYEEAQTVYNLLDVEPNHNYFVHDFLVHNKGGFRSSSRPSTSTKSSTSSKSTTSSKTTTSKPAAPKVGKSTAKPGAKVNGVQSSTKKPANSKYKESTGIVGDNGYMPRYTNGYTPPVGSVVYRENNSALDYLPWIYLFSVMGDSPRNDQQVIVQPDGKEIQAKPVQQGLDGMLILNWIILIIIVVAIIGGIVWLVNKLTGGSKPSYA